MMIKSTFNYNLILLGFLAFYSCIEEPCLDIPKLNQYTELTKSWFVDESIGNTTFTDKNGINQTLIKQTFDYFDFEDTIEDDCGNTYGNFNYSIQYLTSLSNIHFLIDIRGGVFEGDGFYLKLLISNLNNGYKSTEYDFYKEQVRDNNSVIKLLPLLKIGERKFNDVLEINFRETFSPNDVKIVYYSRGNGIIKFTQENGNIHLIN